MILLTYKNHRAFEFKQLPNKSYRTSRPHHHGLINDDDRGDDVDNDCV